MSDLLELKTMSASPRLPRDDSWPSEPLLWKAAAETEPLLCSTWGDDEHRYGCET